MTLAGSGIVVGVVAAFCLTRLMQSLLYQVRPSDPVDVRDGVARAGRSSRCWRARAGVPGDARQPADRVADGIADPEPETTRVCACRSVRRTDES